MDVTWEPGLATIKGEMFSREIDQLYYLELWTNLSFFFLSAVEPVSMNY